MTFSAHSEPRTPSAAPVSPHVALLTQHGKEDLIAPVFRQALGWVVERVSGFDTDLLGTFTRDQERPGSQMDAARLKARKGMELSGCLRGLASEGAFMEDPVGGFFPWNVELLLYIDDEQGIEICGMAQGPARNVHRLVHTWDQATQLAADAHFPEHHLALRPDGESDLRIRKGLSDWASLRQAFDGALAESANGAVFLESDLRAFCNPTRQHLIRAAADNLVAKLQSKCPACGQPGYWPVAAVRGLPCGQCGAPTRELLGERWACPCCHHEHEVLRAPGGVADPSRCDRCNP
jgi:hypothetical protein